MNISVTERDFALPPDTPPQSRMRELYAVVGDGSMVAFLFPF
ncbi:MAG: hypothetical protein R3C19_22345 [Planctomycetaceae bacterium]